MPSENEEDGQHEEDSTELAEVDRPQPPEISGLLASLTPGIERLIAQTLKSQESPARARRFSPEPGPSNDPRFTTHESSRSPGRHDTRGKRTTRKRSRAKKARPQTRPPSKRIHSSSSDSGTYHRSRPLARLKRARRSSFTNSSQERPGLSHKQTRGRKRTRSCSTTSEGSQDLAQSARTRSKDSRPAKRCHHTRYVSESSTLDQSCQSSFVSPVPKQNRLSKVKCKKNIKSKKDSLKLPPLPATLLKKIRNCEYVDFDELLSPALYAPAVFNPTTFELDVSSRTKFSLKATKQGKPQVMDMATWLESWNNFMQATLFFHPELLPQLMAYQASMCHYASKYSIAHVLSYDVNVRQAIATDPLLRWDDRHDTEFDKFLQGNAVPSCFYCNRYGHYAPSCPLKPAESGMKARPLSREPMTHPQGNFHPQPSVPAKLCSEYNKIGKCDAGCPAAAHRCNRSGCGGNHPGFQCPLLRNTRSHVWP